LSRLLVLSIHGHVLAGKDVCKGAFVPKFTISLDEPGADILLAGLYTGVGEGAGRSGSARADLEKFARYVGKVFA